MKDDCVPFTALKPAVDALQRIGCRPRVVGSEKDVGLTNERVSNRGSRADKKLRSDEQNVWFARIEHLGQGIFRGSIVWRDPVTLGCGGSLLGAVMLIELRAGAIPCCQDEQQGIKHRP